MDRRRRENSLIRVRMLSFAHQEGKRGRPYLVWWVLVAGAEKLSVGRRRPPSCRARQINGRRDGRRETAEQPSARDEQGTFSGRATGAISLSFFPFSLSLSRFSPSSAGALHYKHGESCGADESKQSCTVAPSSSHIASMEGMGRTTGATMKVTVQKTTDSMRTCEADD